MGMGMQHGLVPVTVRMFITGYNKEIMGVLVMLVVATPCLNSGT